MKPNYLKKSILYFVVLSTCIAHPAHPYGETGEMDVRALALGNVKALSWGVLNPSCLAFKGQKELGAAVYSRFGMKELSASGIYALLPNRAIDVGVLLSAYGYEDYRLLQGQVNLAKKLSPASFSIGVNLSCIHESSILEAESKRYFSAAVGWFYRISELFEAAFVAENLLRTSGVLPVVCNLGIRYLLLPDCFVLIETGYDFKEDPVLKTGVEYEIAAQFSVRAGFGTRPKTPSLGFAYAGNRWKTEVAFLLHPVLGLSSAIGAACFF
ncbi:MAG: hypothetical protein LBF08_05700 [Dysgonamonadaceae bacterium]|jgi:hypothetical protein|nr:hypothetical protein [Dysgonamonadaceae bacterium]